MRCIAAACGQREADSDTKNPAPASQPIMYFYLHKLEFVCDVEQNNIRGPVTELLHAAASPSALDATTSVFAKDIVALAEGKRRRLGIG